MIKTIVVILILVGALTGYFLGGFYNVSALKPHNSIVESFAQTVKDRSIRKNSKNIIPPPLTVDKKLLKKGFDIYDSNCTYCHNAPGIEDSELSKALYPKPPRFPDNLEYDEIGEKEIFWIVKNGIKMSGMPAYSNSLGDDEIWAVVHFVLELPKISNEDYKDYSRTLIINF
ncbi:MAG: c-type cytochrome [Thermodesulfobacteriota bacterium]